MFPSKLPCPLCWTISYQNDNYVRSRQIVHLLLNETYHAIYWVLLAQKKRLFLVPYSMWTRKRKQACPCFQTEIKNTPYAPINLEATIPICTNRRGTVSFREHNETSVGVRGWEVHLEEDAAVLDISISAETSRKLVVTAWLPVWDWAETVTGSGRIQTAASAFSYRLTSAYKEKPAFLLWGSLRSLNKSGVCKRSGKSQI